MTPTSDDKWPTTEKVCRECKIKFLATGFHQHRRLYCTQECASRYSRRDKVERFSTNLGLNTHTIGAVGELRVCVELMCLGFDVYRAQSPSAKSDLVIVRDRKCFLVQVKNGTLWKSTGYITVPKDKHDYDILAVVLAREILYRDKNGDAIDLAGLQ